MNESRLVNGFGFTKEQAALWNANETKGFCGPAPKTHWTTEMKEENKRLKAAVDYLQFQMRVIVQSRFDKYRNAKDTNETMAYRKAVNEIDNRVNSANCVSQEILDGESHWDIETRKFV